MARKNKKLLSEGQVRQFMKLANLAPLTPGFVHGLPEGREERENRAASSQARRQRMQTRRDRDWENQTVATMDDDPYDDADTAASKAIDWESDVGKAPSTSPESEKAAAARKKEQRYPASSTRHKEEKIGQAEYERAKKIKADPPRSPSEYRAGEEKKAAAAGDPTARRNPQRQQESHGRGRDEGSGGYGHPDPRQRPAGSSLREQDEDMELDVELDDLEGDELGLEDEELGLEDEELEGDLEGGGGREVSVDDFLAALEIALEDVMGEEVEVSQDEEELEDEEMDLAGDELDLEGDELDLEAEEDELALQEKRAHAMQALVGRVTRRVAERLVREKLSRRR